MRTRPAVQELRLAIHAGVAFALLACAGLESQPRAPSPREAPAGRRPSTAAPAGWQGYLVQPGDTLGRIASCRGVSVEELARANGRADPDRLTAGERLRVPAVDRCERAPARDDAARQDAELAELRPAASGVLPAAEASERRARAGLDTAQARYDAARFEEALAGALEAAGELAPHAGRPESDALRARCLLLAGMAATALDERDRALSLFRAAFALDPTLSVSREETSPRILELVDEVVPRGRQAGR